MCSTAQCTCHVRPWGANFPASGLTQSNRNRRTGPGGQMRGRGIVAIVLAWALALVGVGSADAAQYKVSACGPGASYVNHLLTASVSDARMSSYTACPNDGNGHQVGVAALAGNDRGTGPLFANALQSFVAPAGNPIQHAHLKAQGRAGDGGWGSPPQRADGPLGNSPWE